MAARGLCLSSCAPAQTVKLPSFTAGRATHLRRSMHTPNAHCSVLRTPVPRVHTHSQALLLADRHASIGLHRRVPHACFWLHWPVLDWRCGWDELECFTYCTRGLHIASNSRAQFWCGDLWVHVLNSVPTAMLSPWSVGFSKAALPLCLFSCSVQALQLYRTAYDRYAYAVQKLRYEQRGRRTGTLFSDSRTEG